MRLVYCLFAMATLSLGATCTPQAADNLLSPKNWTQLHGDETNGSSNTLDTAPVTAGNIKWSTFVGLAPFASPIAHPNGNVYIGTLEGDLIGLTADGQLALRREFPGEAFLTSPAVDGFGDLYLVATSLASPIGPNDPPPDLSQIRARLLRIAPNGNVLREAGTLPTMASPKIIGDKIFLASRTDVTVYDRNLQVLEFEPTGGGGDICGSSGIDFIDGLLGCIPGDFACYFPLTVDPSVQALVPSVAVTDAPNLVSEGELLVVTVSYPALNAWIFRNNQLERLWFVELDTDVCDADRPAFTSPSIVLGGLVTIGFSTGPIQAFDALTGRREWSIDAGSAVGGQSANFRDVFGVGGGAVLRIAGNGVRLARVPVSGGSFTSPVATFNRVYVCSTTGISTFSRELAEEAFFPQPLNKFSGPAVDFRGNVYVINAGGFMIAFRNQ